MRPKNIKWLVLVVLALAGIAAAPRAALAHCDGIDGPVVKAAQRALDTRNPALALIWVQAKDEPEIRKAFEQTVAVRALSPQAKSRAIARELLQTNRAHSAQHYQGIKSCVIV